MANCQYDHQFDDLTFTCKPCAHAGLSFGIQAKECLLCSQMLEKARSNVLKRQVYMQVCYEGQDKSLAVYILTVCVLIIVGCVCCWELDGECASGRNLVGTEVQHNDSRVRVGVRGGRVVDGGRAGASTSEGRQQLWNPRE